MRSYKYTARDASGQRREGLKEANSSNDVLGWLRDQGFTPVSVTEASAGAPQAKRTQHRKRIKSADLAALCWQLTTMVEGGIPITTALDTISDDIENLQLQEVLKHVLEKMEKGETFSNSIAEFPKVFNNLCCALILAGEAGGNLPESLRRLAEYFDNRDKLAKKVKGAMAYPIFVLGFIILIVVFIMAFIIPRFTSIFDQFGGELPAFTKGFMAVYDMLRYNLIYIIGTVLLVVITSVLLYTKSEKGHYAFCKIALKLPLFGKVFSQAFIVMFCRTMASLLGAGVSVLEVLDILNTMTSNDIIKGAIISTRERVVGGSNISMSLAASGFFPNMVVKMIQVGEESGSLSKVLERTSNYYERKVDAIIDTLMSLLEPIMIVTVGGVVLIVVLALYLPIFSMSA
ncbi:MAG: type II secretion system F family protein [Planctomycetota bacterium]|jgi:type IV pilus assembly protein PilC